MTVEKLCGKRSVKNNQRTLWEFLQNINQHVTRWPYAIYEGESNEKIKYLYILYPTFKVFI